MTERSWTVRMGRRDIEIAMNEEGAMLDGRHVEVRFEPVRPEIARVFVNGFGRTIYFMKVDEYHYDIWVGHNVFRVQVEDSRFRLLRQFSGNTASVAGQNVVTAPMPGLVTKLQVAVGDTVEPGSSLIILEAMKMENEIRSKIHGVVRKIEVGAHASVEKGQTLLILET